MANSRDRVLDFWRGISIAGVLLHHAVYFHYVGFRYFLDSGTGSSLLHKLLYFSDKLLVAVAERSGPWGVDFFFVISGYIITTLMLREENAAGFFNIKKFYVRRFFRIIPPFYFYLLGVLLFSTLGWIVSEVNSVPYSGAFLCNTNLHDCAWNTVHTWTLAIEEQFYIVWPLIFLAVPKRFRIRALTFILGLMIGFSSTGLLVAHTWIDNPLAFACIGTGALYAADSRFRSYMNRFGWAVCIFVFALLGALYEIKLPGMNNFVHVLFREATPIIVLSIIATSYRMPWLARSKFFAAMNYLGLISYSLYLWQEVFLAPYDNYPTPSPLLFPPLMFAFAIFSYIVIERPIIFWAREYTKKAFWLA